MTDEPMQVATTGQVNKQPRSLRALGAILGVSRETIRRDLALRPVEAYRVVGLDGKSYPANEDGQRATAAAVLALRERGMKQTEIAAELGLSQPTVSRLLSTWHKQDT